MSSRIKRKRSFGSRPQVPVYENEIFLIYDLSSLPRHKAVALTFLLVKFAMLENGRVVGRRGPQDGYETIVGVPDQAGAERITYNVEAAFGSSLAPYLVASGSEAAKSPLEPFAAFLTELEMGRLALMLAQDEDSITNQEQFIAKRMERDPSGDYLFPNLSPEKLAELKAKTGRKPS